MVIDIFVGFEVVVGVSLMYCGNGCMCCMNLFRQHLQRSCFIFSGIATSFQRCYPSRSIFKHPQYLKLCLERLSCWNGVVLSRPNLAEPRRMALTSRFGCRSCEGSREDATDFGFFLLVCCFLSSSPSQRHHYLSRSRGEKKTRWGEKKARGGRPRPNG